jgi:hypothetical protein
MDGTLISFTLFFQEEYQKMLRLPKKSEVHDTPVSTMHIIKFGSVYQWEEKYTCMQCILPLFTRSNIFYRIVFTLTTFTLDESCMHVWPSMGCQFKDDVLQSTDYKVYLLITKKKSFVPASLKFLLQRWYSAVYIWYTASNLIWLWKPKVFPFYMSMLSLVLHDKYILQVATLNIYSRSMSHVF